MSNRVVYLVGAGASHGCVESVNSPHGILMQHLSRPLHEKLSELVTNGFSGDDSLVNLVNSVIDDTTDFEHIITFLEDAPSLLHRKFAEAMRDAFEEVLRERLSLIIEETQGDAIRLYKVLLDIYNIKKCPEVLQGIITTNYDEFMEEAIEQIGNAPVDFGIRVEPSTQQPGRFQLLKLHGSFGWRDAWPVSRWQSDDDTLWIPPGIQKAKQAYPFNVLWGLAREMLSCDVLRIIGFSLTANDWDMISLLFTMRHVNLATRPQIEIIDAPQHVEQLKEKYPYLELLSMLEIEPVGSQLIAEFTGWPPQQFDTLSMEQKNDLFRVAGTRENWFEEWLKAKVESLYIELGDVSTDAGLVEEFLNA